MNIYSKIHTLMFTLYGFCLKVSYDVRGHLGLPCLHPDPEKKGNVVVSLTSYGRRVEKSIVYYTLVSILRQTQLPDRIILWLNQDKWNDDNLPTRLKYLRDHHGVEIRFCEDIRSYTKLIPTLQLCPDDIIITVDDDIIYHRTVVRSMMERYHQHPDCIVGFGCLRPCLNKIGKIQKYRKWPLAADGETSLSVFPLGYNVVLYPPHTLHEDVFDRKVYQSLCPYADDVWFWLQGLRKGTQHHCLVTKRIHNHSFDALYQLFHRGSALMHVNLAEQNNEKQMEACMDYYKMDIKSYLE